MFDFLDKQTQEKLNALGDKDVIKAEIEKYYNSQIETAKTSAQADIEAKVNAGVEAYKTKIETDAKEAAQKEMQELAQTLKGETLANIQKLFVNITDDKGFIKELETRGLAKNKQVALMLAELGKRWEQEARPAGSPSVPPKPTETALEQLRKRRAQGA